MEWTAFPFFQGHLFGVCLVDLEHPLHLGCEPAAVDLDVQFVVAEHAEAVDVRAAYRRPETVSGGRLGVDHDVPVEEDPDTVFQKIVEVTPREPVRGDVVRLLGDEQLYVDATLRRVYQVRFQRAVGDEVCVGQIDVGVGAVYRLDVHLPYGEDPHVRVVAAHPYGGVPVTLLVGGYPGQLLCAVGIPEVDESVVHLPGNIATHPDVRVAPSRRVKGPDVVATKERDPAVNAHHVAVEPEDVPGVEYLRRSRQGTEVQAVYLRGKPLERRRHQHIGQPVEDDVNLDSLARLTGQGIHKTASDLISFPDERPDEDLVLCSLDLVEHRLVEADPVGVDLQPVLARLHSYLGLVLPRESLPQTLAALAELGHRDEHTNDHRLQRRQCEEDPQSQSAQRRESGTHLRYNPPREREHRFDYIERSANRLTLQQEPPKFSLIPTFGACARRGPSPPR